MGSGINGQLFSPKESVRSGFHGVTRMLWSSHYETSIVQGELQPEFGLHVVLTLKSKTRALQAHQQHPPEHLRDVTAPKTNACVYVRALDTLTSTLLEKEQEYEMSCVCFLSPPLFSPLVS